jgi:hypothetical protein
MKKKLLAGAAMAIAIGCTAATAQAQEGSQGNGAGNSPGGAQHRLNPGGTSGGGGAMRNNQATPGGSVDRNQAIPEKQGMGPPKGSNQQRSSSTRQRGTEENGGVTRRGGQENNMQRGAEGNHSTDMQRGTENERGGAMRENRENNSRIQERGSRTGSASGKSVQLSERKRTQIKNLIVKDRSVPRANSSNFSVAVGTALPHDVHVAPLPSDVIRVVPEYRGFDYVVVRDQLLIIDPDTMKIVAILPT